MHKFIKKAAVLGSGVMGSGIAAHLANIGIPVLLLDIVPNELTKDEMKKGLTLESPEVPQQTEPIGHAKAAEAKTGAADFGCQSRLYNGGEFGR